MTAIVLLLIWMLTDDVPGISQLRYALADVATDFVNAPLMWLLGFAKIGLVLVVLSAYHSSSRLLGVHWLFANLFVLMSVVFLSPLAALSLEPIEGQPNVIVCDSIYAPCHKVTSDYLVAPVQIRVGDQLDTATQYAGGAVGHWLLMKVTPWHWLTDRVADARQPQMPLQRAFWFWCGLSVLFLFFAGLIYWRTADE